MDDIKTVNVVGVGLLDEEFDLNSLATSLPENVRYEPEMHPGLYLRIENHRPLMIIYGTGKFIVTGAKSEDEVYHTRDEGARILSEVTSHPLGLKQFELCNYVLSGDLGTELDLSTITVGLGLERTEYNPETISAVLYTPEQANCTVMIFRSGKVNIVGESSRERSEQAFQELKNKIRSLLAEE